MRWVDGKRQEALAERYSGSEASKSYQSRFLVKDGEKEILLPAEKIDWIEAAEYYCCLLAHEWPQVYVARDHYRFEQ